MFKVGDIVAGVGSPTYPAYEGVRGIVREVTRLGHSIMTIEVIETGLLVGYPLGSTVPVFSSQFVLDGPIAPEPYEEWFV